MVISQKNYSKLRITRIYTCLGDV